jgi:Glucose-6-phosphate dehydrogenase, NAD binding domain
MHLRMRELCIAALLPQRLPSFTACVLQPQPPRRLPAPLVPRPPDLLRCLPAGSEMMQDRHDSQSAQDMIQEMVESYDLDDSSYSEEAMLSIVVVGGSGDLAKKKIFPALFALYHQGLLPKHVQIVAYARSESSNEQFREKVMGTLTCRVDAGCAPARPRARPPPPLAVYLPAGALCRVALLESRLIPLKAALARRHGRSVECTECT